MRRRRFLGLAVGALTLPACGGDGGGGIVVRPLTAAHTPTRIATPIATATPVPPPEADLSTREVYQGGAVLVSLLGTVESGRANFLGRDYPLTQGARSIYAYVAAGSTDPAGAAQLTITFKLPGGSTGTLTEDLTVLETDWTVDSVEFTDEQALLLDPRVVAEENALLEQVYSTYTPEKRWAGGWIVPVGNPVTARFGEQRSVNGGPPSGHHTGTDFGADLGTPVLATNSGRVVLSRQLNLRGNMLILDHGGGLYSGYAHLSAFIAAAGQLVAQGEQIALSGNTGLSTGAHLHWEIASNGVQLDALRFVDGSNGF